MKWNFDNSFARLPKKFYTRQNPISVRDPKPVIYNKALAETLEVPLDTDVFAGNKIPEGSEPLAQAYAGHQFGHFTMLGDGRAILIGEHITSTHKRFDIQLKGSGKTPYSRGGDGRAALGPMLREYIISEAMYALGIPTTRSLAVIETGEMIRRERPLHGGILTRVASSHIRVGTFEYASRFCKEEDVRALADYTIERHFPDILPDNKYLSLLKEVVKRQAYLISKWQLVGFIHGVMNTDNMAISGETIDFGPCAFMDTYHPSTVFSSIDTQKRYSFENQPKMAVWNLSRFAETLLPLLHEDENKAISLGQQEVSKFRRLYHDNWLAGMRAKLGLYNNEEQDEILFNDLLKVMQNQDSDYTNTFRALTLGLPEHELSSEAEFQQWNESWQMRLKQQQKSKEEVQSLMRRHNPSVIPRNHRVEQALAAVENGNLNLMEELLQVIGNPFGYLPQHKEYAELPESACNYKTFCGT